MYVLSLSVHVSLYPFPSVSLSLQGIGVGVGVGVGVMHTGFLSDLIQHDLLFARQFSLVLSVHLLLMQLNI